MILYGTVIVRVLDNIDLSILAYTHIDILILNSTTCEVLALLVRSIFFANGNLFSLFKKTAMPT